MNLGTFGIALVLAGIYVVGLAGESSGEETLKSSFKDARFSESGHTVDDLNLVKLRLAGKHAVLIDVRELAEWDAGHLKDAKLVPMSAIKSMQLDSDMKKALPKGKPIYYSDVATYFMQDEAIVPLSFNVNNLEYKFPNGAIGLHEINMQRAWDGTYDEWVQKSYAELKRLMPGRFNKPESEVAYVEAIH